MKNINTTLLKNLKSTGLSFNLWNSNLLDRIVSDYILNTKLKVMGVMTNNPHHRNGTRCKYYNQIPVKLLPNCASYKVVSSKLSWLSGLFNLVSRTGRASGVMVGWVNTHRNGWLLYMFNSLGHLRDTNKSRKYWKLAQKLMKSSAYQVSSFHYTCPDWHTTLSGSEVENVFRDLNNIISDQELTIDYRRVYIPKTNGKVRPLGVPTLAWRVYLHMLNNMIVWWKLGLEPTQHGYLPKRGVLTCWTEVLTQLTSSSSVYEFDLKGFFDNVNLKELEYELSQIGVPSEIISKIGGLNRSVVKLTDTDKIDESAHRKIVLNSDHSLNPNLPVSLKRELSSASDFEYNAKVHALISEGYSLYRTHGVPQGAATSCGLSTLSLRQLYSDFHACMYADDGVIFNSSDEPSCTYPSSGIFKEPTKSGWVKQRGKFLTSLKFLGLEYIPPNVKGKGDGSLETYPRLRSNTRSGSTLEFDMSLQFLCYLSSKYKELYDSVVDVIQTTTDENFDQALSGPPDEIELSKDSLKELVNPSLTLEAWIATCHEVFLSLPINRRLLLLFTTPAGPVTLSRMYNGSPNLLNVSDSRLVFTKRSWVSTKWGSYLYRYSLTTFYRELVDHLVSNNLVHLPSCLQDCMKMFPSTELFLTAYTSLFKQRGVSPQWKIRDQERSEFKKYRLFLKWYLKVVKLSQINSSTFACDDLLSYLKLNGNITGWKHGPEVYCKSSFIKYIDPKCRKTKFEESKSQLLKNQQTKLKRELQTLHKEFYYNRNNPLS